MLKPLIQTPKALQAIVNRINVVIPHKKSASTTKGYTSTIKNSYKIKADTSQSRTDAETHSM